MHNMEILTFRYVTKSDPYDPTYPHWSRKWEYPTVIAEIDKIVDQMGRYPKIHNSSWGFDPDHHTRFKNQLEKKYLKHNVTNSDIVFTGVHNSCYHDITQPPNEQFKEAFDIVLNISAIEEIPGDHDLYLDNLAAQVVPGGYLICTFDYPGLRLNNFNDIFTKEGDSDKISEHTQFWFGPGDLNVLLFIAKKNQS